jgi:hypothetical protein
MQLINPSKQGVLQVRVQCTTFRNPEIQYTCMNIPAEQNTLLTLNYINISLVTVQNI